MQTRIYVAQKRDWEQKHGHGYETWLRCLEHKNKITERKFRVRKRYYRRLLLALSDGCQDVGRKFDLAMKNINQLYQLRNDLAHGAISISAFFEEPHIKVSSSEWFDLFELNRRKTDVPSREKWPKHWKIYTIDQLVSALAEMRATYRALIVLHPDKPGHVPMEP